jgi:hypothetical protein
VFRGQIGSWAALRRDASLTQLVHDPGSSANLRNHQKGNVGHCGAFSTTAERKTLRGNLHLSAEGLDTENFSPVKTIRFALIRTNQEDDEPHSSGIKVMAGVNVKYLRSVL